MGSLLLTIFVRFLLKFLYIIVVSLFSPKTFVLIIYVRHEFFVLDRQMLKNLYFLH